MNKKNLITAVGLVMGVVVNGGSVMANPAQDATVVAPVILAQNNDTPVTPTTDSTGASASPSVAPEVSINSSQENDTPATTQPGPTSGAITPVSSDYYRPQVQALGEGISPKLPIRFGATLALISDDNINISASNKQSDFLEVLTPTVTFETSRLEEDHPFYIGLTFDPTLAFYDSHSNNNYTDYHVRFDAQYQFSKLLVGVTQTYDSYNGANIEFGGRLFSEVFNTRVYAAMPITEKINWDIEGVQTITDYDQGYDTDQWLADSYLDYEVLPKLRIGAGGEFGVLNFPDGYQTNGGQVPNQPNNGEQTFQQGNLRAIYAYSDKLSLTAKLGGEVREYEGAGDTLTPVMDIGAVWTPFVHSTIQFDAFRRTVAAISQHDTDYDFTGFDIALRQGFLRQFAVDLGLGYNNSTYNNIAPVQSYSGLTYNYYTVRPSVEWTPNKHFTASIYYQYQKNATTIPGSGFEDNQFGISGSVAY